MAGRLERAARWLDPRLWARQAYVRAHGLAEANRISTHLTVAEKIRLHRLARSLAGRGAVAVEIGSYLGASACFLAAGLGREGRLVCIDTWQNETMPEGRRDTFADFLRNTAPFGNVTACRGASEEVFAEVARSVAGTVDLLFVDGDHSHEACLRDWRLYSTLLRDGALVAFHDVGWAPGVRAVVDGPVAAVTARLEGPPNLAVLRFHGGGAR